MTAHHGKSLSSLTLRTKLVQSWNVGYDVIENDVIEIHSKNTCMTANLENISFFSIFLNLKQII